MIFVLDIITLARSVTISFALPSRDLNNSLKLLCQQLVTDVKVILCHINCRICCNTFYHWYEQLLPKT